MKQSVKPVVLRLARESDLDALLLLIHDTIEFSYRDVYPDSAVKFFKRYHSGEKILERIRGGLVLVFEKQGRLVATGSLVGNEILGVFVCPDHQSRGYGRLMMSVLESHARVQNIHAVTLNVSLPSERFYRALGYQILDSNHLNMEDGSVLKYFSALKILLP